MSSFLTLYWITDDSSASIITHGYVGITSKKLETRIGAHKNNYAQFLKGKPSGCRKLYTKIKFLGGWDNVKVIPICYSSLDYCLDLEYKLRPNARIGWNTLHGGVIPGMYLKTLNAETKSLLRKVRSNWRMSQETIDRLSKERTGNGNPMYGTPPWYYSKTAAMKLTWLKADELYNIWINKPCGMKSMTKLYPDLNPNSIDSAIRKFRKGWIPVLDEKWLLYKEQNEKSC